MANNDAPAGFKPRKHRNGAPYNGAAKRYLLPASDGTATYVGDAVKLAGSADATGQYATIAQAATGDRVVGVIVAFEANPDNLNQLYRPASQARYALVADDPDLLFEVQEDGVGATIAATDIGLNANFVVAAGNTTSGASGMELDISTKNTTNTLDLKIHGLAQRVDNELTTNAKVLVSFNKHQFVDQVAGV